MFKFYVHVSATSSRSGNKKNITLHSGTSLLWPLTGLGNSDFNNEVTVLPKPTSYFSTIGTHLCLSDGIYTFASIVAR